MNIKREYRQLVWDWLIDRPDEEFEGEIELHDWQLKNLTFAIDEVFDRANEIPEYERMEIVLNAYNTIKKRKRV